MSDEKDWFWASGDVRKKPVSEGEFANLVGGHLVAIAFFVPGREESRIVDLIGSLLMLPADRFGVALFVVVYQKLRRDRDVSALA